MPGHVSGFFGFCQHFFRFTPGSTGCEGVRCRWKDCGHFSFLTQIPLTYWKNLILETREILYVVQDLKKLGTKGSLHFSWIGKSNHKIPHILCWSFCTGLNECIVLESAVEVGTGRIPLILDTVNLSFGASF